MHISVPSFAALGAALTLFISTPVYSQQSPSAQTGKKDDKNEVTSGDRRFMTRAAQMGLAEVAASRVAMEKASSPEVKKFAEHMVKDHEKANAELRQIASGKGVSLPASPDAKHQEALKELRGLSGDKFDRKYMEQTGVKDHKAALSLFQDGAKDAKDPQLKAYFEKHAPNIKKHLAMAQDIAAQADGGDSRKRSGRPDESKADGEGAARKSDRQGSAGSK